MQVKVNEKSVEIFSGARVKDVVRKYSRTAWKQVRGKKYSVFDRYGHEVALDGELSGGEGLFVRSVEPEKRQR
ncbi:MAG: hypothetical protein NTW38_04565 [Candidatus Aminicenantes bacterium]|nr:hypothetical protein [Candidatus Aminicenantes bacterium]